MSLRADIISAYDEIAPPAPQLQAQIRMSVSAEARAASQSRRTRGPWMTSLRGTMALVAALLVVLIVATVLVGGRVMHDWDVFNNRPAPAGSGDAATQIAMLEARPLHLPQVPTDGTCPAGPLTPNRRSKAGSSYGRGTQWITRSRSCSSVRTRQAP